MASLRKSLFVLAGFLFVSAGAPVHADPYKWCAVGTGVGGSGSNCGFMTFEQCLATTRGGGGFCQPNQFYTGDSGTQKSKTKKKAQN